MSCVAILCPAGTVTDARIFSLMISVPAGNSTRAMTTSSAGLRRIVRSAACNMVCGLLGRRPAWTLSGRAGNSDRYFRLVCALLGAMFHGAAGPAADHWLLAPAGILLAIALRLFFHRPGHAGYIVFEKK